jgi:EAL domain-containing protein (putative c-di-GMP-specific phosphodiesterase class I)
MAGNGRQAAAIVRSTNELGHNLGLKVVAEGVEDEKTLDLLSSFGCDSAQGYFIARPMPAADLVGWLQASSWNGHA